MKFQKELQKYTIRLTRLLTGTFSFNVRVRRKHTVPECTSLVLLFLAATVLLTSSRTAMCQFSASVQGTVADPSGATIGGANVTLVNVDTNVSRVVISANTGIYLIPSLAPGNYRISAAHSGFETQSITFSLNAAENRNIAFSLPIGKATSAVTVTSQAPILDTSDSRNELTLPQEAIADLPLPGLNVTLLTLLAPGVTGKGPGYGTAGNFGTESNDISANGGGDNSNDYILDGLDLNLSVNAGTTGLVPSPDALSQITVETNTYTSDYGRAAAVQTIFTSKAGTAKFHGFASEYYSYQGLDAKGEFFPAKTAIEPFHTNNMSFGVGGPILSPKHQFFGFFSIEPYRSLASNGTSVTQVEDPAFVTFAQTAAPQSPELQLFTDLPPSGATITGVASTAQSQFGATNSTLGTGCATPSTDNIPCSLPVTDDAVFNSSSFTNAMQWNTRVDKYFGARDRLYGTIFRVTNTNGGPAIRPLQANNEYIRNIFYQVNETHIFSPKTLNEISFGVVNLNYNEYVPQNSGLYKFPYVTVTGLAQSYGLNEINFLYGETNYHWRDVVTHIIGSHSIKAGYEWYRGTDPANLAIPYSQPTLTYTSLINFINNDIYSESNLAYNPLTGQPEAARYNYGIISQGAFAEDTWKIGKKLTVNYGIRWDNEGNAYPLSPSTFISNFHLAPASTFVQQVANGVMTQQKSLLNHDLQPVISPRVGAAWDPAGNGKWVVRGGIGVYRDWVTLGNEVTKILSNPPDYVQPTFRNDGSTVGRPIFGLATQTTYPLGFPYPTLEAGALNAQGGLVGDNLTVGGVDGNLKAPYTISWSGTIERQITSQMVASIGIVGSHSGELQHGFAKTFANSLAPDVNVSAGDLLQNLTCPATGTAGTCTGKQVRPNPSFGTIYYGYNGPRANYDGVVLAIKGRFAKRGFITASYTYAHSNDNTTNFPIELPLSRYYGPSVFDVRSSFNMGFNYSIHGLNGGQGLLGRALSGWNVASDVFLQSGEPFTAYNDAPLLVDTTASGVLSYDAKSGDFIADGDNNMALPNVSSYKMSHSRDGYKTGVFAGCTGGTIQCGQFSIPQFNGLAGTEGNEDVYAFRNPGYAEVDSTLKKVTAIKKGINLEIRLDIFNLFNRVNLSTVDGNAADTTFGKVTGLASIPRQGQIAAKLTF